MKLHDVPAALVAQIARETLASYREHLHRLDYCPEEAEEAAVREMVEGAAVDVEAIRAERATEPVTTALDSADWPY